MRAPGIIGTLQLAALLVFAVPLVWFGVDALYHGRTLLGAAFLLFGVLLVGLQWWLTNPLDPLDLAEDAIQRLTRDKE